MLLRTGTVEIAVIALARPLGSGGVDLAAVVARPLLGIAKKIIGRRNLLELLLRLPIAGMEVGVHFFGELPIDLTHLVLRRLGLHAQHSVGILAHVALLIWSTRAETRERDPRGDIQQPRCARRRLRSARRHVRDAQCYRLRSGLPGGGALVMTVSHLRQEKVSKSGLLAFDLLPSIE